MRLICLCVLAVDAVLGAEVDVVLAHVLAALVIARRLDAQAQAVLRIGLVRLERSKRVALHLQQHHSAQARAVVDKGDRVAIARVSGHRKRAVGIRMDELQRFVATISGQEEGRSVQLACKAGLTDRIRALI